MRYLKAIIPAILIALFSSFPALQTRICYSDNPSSTIVDNVYSSVVLITHKKIKTSIWDVLSFALLVGGAAAGIGGVGQVLPGHIDKTVGTGFQTKWGIVTNSHVMDDKSKAVLTTFFKRSYRIKKINRVICRDQHVSLNEAKIIQATSKEATVYDRW